MPIELIDKIKPKNGGEFPLVDAADVLMPDGTRLSTFEGGGGDIPTFDLISLGLPAIQINGAAVELATDTTEMRAALQEGAVRFKVNAEHNGVSFNNFALTVHDISGGFCSYAFEILGTPTMLTIIVVEGKITATGVILAKYSEEEEAAELPTFDLTAMGLPAVPMDGTQVAAEMDTTEIMTALDNGAVKFLAKFLFGNAAVAAEVVMTKISVDAAGIYICSYAFDFEGTPMIFNLYVQEGGVMAYYTALGQSETPAVSIDMTAFESAGQIVETFADGSTKTTTMEFDEAGNPVKITDGDGNVTTLTW